MALGQLGLVFKDLDPPVERGDFACHRNPIFLGRLHPELIDGPPQFFSTAVSSNEIFAGINRRSRLTASVKNRAGDGNQDEKQQAGHASFASIDDTGTRVTEKNTLRNERRVSEFATQLSASRHVRNEDR